MLTEKQQRLVDLQIKIFEASGQEFDQLWAQLWEEFPDYCKRKKLAPPKAASERNTP